MRLVESQNEVARQSAEKGAQYTCIKRCAESWVCCVHVKGARVGGSVCVRGGVEIVRVSVRWLIIAWLLSRKQRRVNGLLKPCIFCVRECPSCASHSL
jgi:hypothetical protein